MSHLWFPSRTERRRPAPRPAARRGLVALLAVLGLIGFGLAGPATAADEAYLRAAHLSPDTPAVDVYVISVADPSVALTLQAVGYGDVSAYNRVPAGSYTIAMRPAGADPATPPVISLTVDAQPGTANTVAGVGTFATLGLKVLSDDLALPPANQARVRVIQAAASAPTLDIGISSGPALGTGVAFASTTDYVDVDAGSWTLTAAVPNGTPQELPISLEAGSVYSVLVLDASTGGYTTRLMTDAAASGGSGPVPQTSVDAGAGGTASTVDPITPAAVGALALLGLVLSGLGVRRHYVGRHRAAVS